MGVAVLGPLEVDGRANGLGPRDRVVLSALVVRAGDPVSTEGLADALWGERPPASWTKVVQGCVVRLRKLLGPAAIESGAFGYRLVLTDDELDVRMFERVLVRAREALGGGDPARASYLAHEALRLWRGRALADLDEWEPGRVEALRLEGLRLEAEELWVEADAGAGRAASVVDRARAMVAQEPFRERRWALLATALYKAGRQREALEAIQRARSMLVDELGLDPGHDLVRLEELLLRHDASLDSPSPAEAVGDCPYRGLLPYGAEDADLFFGREDDLSACLRRLRDSRVLAVVGPSGVGKSSLVRAGVVASLARVGAPVLVIAPGPHPLDSLKQLKPRGRQTLVVDQAEEAVTVCTDPGERELFFAALAAHVGVGGGLVLSLRADHLGDLAPYRDIAQVLEDGLYLLGPMSEPDLRTAVEGPARRAGLRLEPGLVDLLVRDVEDEPAALPLLSHVLRETWERREGPTLTVIGYRATGGIRHAVARSAETLYGSMDKGEQQQLRSMLLRLVWLNENGDAVRARLPRSKVAADDAHSHLVERLVDARLVSVDSDTIQVAHESLARFWPRLRGWLDDDADGQRLLRHLTAAADAWDAMDRPTSELYRGARLSRVMEWRERAAPELTDYETDFLAASTALAESELHAAEARTVREHRVNRQLRVALTAVGALLVVAVATGALAVRAADRADRARARAEDSSARALAAAALADARRASAQAPLQDDLATGLLLAVAALDVEDSAQARENLGAVLTAAGPLAGVRDLGDVVGRPGTAWIAHMAASTNGLLAASVAQEGVQLFSTPDLEPVAFREHFPSPAVALSPDGTQMAVAVDDATPAVRLYDVPAGVPSERQLGGVPAGLRNDYASLDFSADGTRIKAELLRPEQRGEAGNPVGVVAVWDLAHPSRPVFVEHVTRPGATALSPDGRRLYVAVGGNRSLRAFDVDSGRVLRSAEVTRWTRHGGPSSLEVAPDGATLAVAAGSQVILFESRTLEPRSRLSAHAARVNDVSYARSGRLLVSASEDHTAIVWDLDSGALLHRFVGRDSLRTAAFGDGDRTVYATGADGLLLAWHVGGASRLLTLGEDTDAGLDHLEQITVPAPDGRTLARGRAGEIWFEDIRRDRSTSPVPSPDNRFTWSPDSHWLATTGARGVVRIWEVDRGVLASRRRVPDAADAADLVVAFSPDSARVYVASGTTLRTLARASLRAAYDDIELDGRPTALLPHPADGSVVVLLEDGSLARVRPETGETLSSLSPGMLAPEDQMGALSPDGTVMAAPDVTHTVRLLDLETLEWVGSDPNAQMGDHLTYAPDGSQFVTVQPDRVRLWDGQTGDYQASLSLPVLTSEPSISYLPDSSGLLVAAQDGRVWVMNTRLRSWVPRACRIAGRNLTRAEWQQFFPTSRYEVSCPQWPAGT